MTTVRLVLGHHSISCHALELSAHVPVGTRTISATITHDPPHPEELTNAIGLVHDHLEDATRELPHLETAERVELAGDCIDVIAAVEAGAATGLPFELSREAAEDVFRTLVTEAAAQRRHNPGLPDTMVHEVLGAACAVVAVMRFLHCERVWLTDAGEAPA